MTARITLVHTVGALADRFRELFAARLPTARIDDVVMEHLLQRTIEEGRLSARTRDELAAAVTGRADDADVVLVTCSSLGPAVDELAQRVGTPVIRVDEAMARRAVHLGDRIGVLATLSTTLEPTTALLDRVAGEEGRHVELVPQLCDGAFDAVRGGDTDRHDALVRHGLTTVLAAGVDVVVLAQASMARVVDTLPTAPAVPVLSSPQLAVDHVASLLEAQAVERGEIDATERLG